MSLARLAMRIAAARALSGATLAETRVFDSAIDPIDQTIAEKRAPVLIVTTDDYELDVTGRDLRHGPTRCDLVIEAAIASRVEVAGATQVSIPHTDEGMELVLDLIEHQVIVALIRPLTDVVQVVPPIVRRTAIEARLILYPGPDGTVVRTRALQALTEWVGVADSPRSFTFGFKARASSMTA